MLLEAGADIHATDKHGNTPLMLAIIHEASQEIRQMVLEATFSAVSPPWGCCPILFMAAMDVALTTHYSLKVQPVRVDNPEFWSVRVHQLKTEVSGLKSASELAAAGREALDLHRRHLRHLPDIFHAIFDKWEQIIRECERRAMEAQSAKGKKAATPFPPPPHGKPPASPLPSPPNSEDESTDPSTTALATAAAAAAAASPTHPDPTDPIALLTWIVEALCQPNPMAISNGEITVETMLSDVKVLKKTLADHFERRPGEAYSSR